MNELRLSSFAKINLGLLLLGKREDGYHDIATIFQQIDLHDTLDFQKTPSSVRIESSSKEMPLDATNLVCRAFALFQKRLKIKEGMQIHIEKRIPMGAGLGGGSSNAAATLIAADRLWSTRLSLPELEEMAVEIGSDVPFFLRGGTALGLGRGNVLESGDWKPGWWILLVCPAIQVSTAWAYGQARIALTKNEKFTNFRSIFDRQNFDEFSGTLVNELEEIVFRRHPILRKIKEELIARDAFYASMSGSGSAVYGLYSSREEAEEQCPFFSKTFNAVTSVCKPVTTPFFME